MILSGHKNCLCLYRNKEYTKALSRVARHFQSSSIFRSLGLCGWILSYLDWELLLPGTTRVIIRGASQGRLQTSKNCSFLRLISCKIVRLLHTISLTTFQRLMLLTSSQLCQSPIPILFHMQDSVLYYLLYVCLLYTSPSPRDS